MKNSIPNDTEIVKAIAEIFDTVYQHNPLKILSALVTVDKHFILGYKTINYVVDYEMMEICEFINEFKSLLKETKEIEQQIRIKVLIYCHIMEADLPYMVFWNLLRILNSQDCKWTFQKQKSDNTQYVYQYTWEKISQINNLSKKLNLKIGDILTRLWNGNLRNAFNHSQYTFMGNFLQCTKNLIPFSRKISDLNKSLNFSFSTIDKYFEGSKNYLSYFIEAYKHAIKYFQDGKTYSIQDGLIRWDKSKTWVWEKP